MHGTHQGLETNVISGTNINACLSNKTVMKMNILVTGGAGYIGSGLILKLGKEFPEATITSIDNLTTGDYQYIDYLKKEKRYRFLVGDIRKRSDAKKAITQDTDVILHLAALSGVEACRKQPKKAVDTNFYGTHLLLEEATNHNVERFVFTSSAAVYGTPQKPPITEEHPLEPINLYGITKLGSEKLVKACYTNTGLTTTIFRLSNVYGLSAYTQWESVIPRFVWQTINDQPLTIRGDGRQQRNFVHVQDVIDAVIKGFQAPKKVVAGETFNLGGESLSVNNIAEIVTQEAKRKLGKEALRFFVPPLSGEVYTPEFNYSSKKISQKIDYKPKKGLSKGVSELFVFASKVKKATSRY